jgi:polyisoprenyl-teichoic acid--peptidoglycan teichoic acid transferase
MTSAPLSLRAFGHRVLVALLICCLIIAVFGVAVVRAEDAKVAKIRVANIDPSLLTPGDNYLIVGSDTRSFVSSKADAEHFGSAQSQGGQRSDTMMVVHIDPGKKTGVLVSFPRDLWVDVPGHGTNKINAAFAFGGAQLTIQTIKQNFGVPINHYLEVDFAGFRDIVNAIGSVPIYFPFPARDHNSGLNIPTAGCINLNGDNALAYVRSRYYEYKKNGEWISDPTSDLGRIERQQYFIRSLASAAIHSVMTHPFSVNKVADKSVAALTRDKKLSASDVRALVFAFRNPDPAAFPMMTLPATGAYRDNQSVLLLDSAQAAPMLARLRGQAPASTSIPKISPSTVTITVENGSGEGGAASRAQSALVGAGFQAPAAATDADRSDYTVTEVRYGPNGEKKAQLVLAYLGGAGKLVAEGAAPKSGADVVVVLGQDFQQVTVPAAATTTTPTSPSTKHPATKKHATTSTTGPRVHAGGPVPVAGC